MIPFATRDLSDTIIVSQEGASTGINAGPTAPRDETVLTTPGNMSSAASTSPPTTLTTPRRRPRTHHGSPSSSTFTPRKPTPLEGARRLLSPQAFQERHATYFAHLHEHEDEQTRRVKLADEKARLEEEQRVGREKRRSMMERLQEEKQREREDVQEQVPVEDGSGRGWKPLNLVQRRRQGMGHARAVSQQTAAVGIRAPPRPVSHEVKSMRRLSLSAPLAQLRNVSENTATRQQLDVVIERESTPPPDVEVLADTSLNKSTYSWATEFSGETDELRTTAHYVRKSLDEEGPLDTPQKVTHRRKRIVALAHTVRQLEGVGSRDVEDPMFYHILVKAWNDRRGTVPKRETAGLTAGPPALLPPPHLLPYRGAAGELVLPSPDSTSTHTSTAGIRYGRYSDLSPPDFSTAFYSHFSPPEPQIKTPFSGTSGFPPPLQAEAESSSARSAQSRQSVRYSYASTLHDLAIDGGFQQGETLMSERAWLKSPATGWGGGNPFNMEPPLGIFAADEHRQPSMPAAEDATAMRHSVQITPERRLRKHRANIHRAPECQAEQVETPPEPENATLPFKGGWGLGFVSDWWRPRSDDAIKPPAEFAVEAQTRQGFHQGEDGIQAGTRGSRRFVVGPGGSGPAPLASEADGVEDEEVQAIEKGVVAAREMTQAVKVEGKAEEKQDGASGYPSSSPCQPANCSTHSITFFLPLEPLLPPLPPDGEGEPSSPTLATSLFPWTTHHPHSPCFGPIPIHSLVLDSDTSTPDLRPTPSPTLPLNSPSSPTTRRQDYVPSFSPISSSHAHTPDEHSLALPTTPTTPASPAGPTPIILTEYIPLPRTIFSASHPHIAPAKVRPSRSTQALFFLGFIMPWCWVFGGWPIYRSARRRADIEFGLRQRLSMRPSMVSLRGGLRANEKRKQQLAHPDGTSWWYRWISHPDPWARRCRVAATVAIPPILLAGVVALITFVVLR